MKKQQNPGEKNKWKGFSVFLFRSVYCMILLWILLFLSYFLVSFLLQGDVAVKVLSFVKWAYPYVTFPLVYEVLRRTMEMLNIRPSDLKFHLGA